LNIDQLRADDQCGAALSNAAAKYHADVELVPNRLRLMFRPSEAKRRTSRNDTQIFQPRESGDDTLGDSVGKNGDIGIGR
jgi:hypothetical protein